MEAEKLLFYEALLQQLRDDGFEDAAVSVKKHVKVEPNTLLRKNHLYELFRASAYLPPRTVAEAACSDPVAASQRRESRLLDILNEASADSGPLDPLYKLVGFASFCDFPTYRPCRCIAESSDGSLLATGGKGGSLHVIPTVEADGDTLLRKPNGNTTTRLHGHKQLVSCVDFHPRRNVLASGGMDRSIIVHDISVENGFVHSATEIQRLADSAQIRCVRFHPCGDFLFAGTANSILRLFDVSTRSCFTSSHAHMQHQGGGINGCDVLYTGGLTFTAGGDGAVLVWDGKNLEVLHAFEGLHSGTPVLSVRCDKYGRYITSSGHDGSTKVTDLRMMRQLLSLGGRPGQGTHRTFSDFLYNSRYLATFSITQSGRRLHNSVLVYNVDTGSQEADVSSILGRTHIWEMMSSKNDMALYLLGDDSSCKVVSFFDPSA